MKNYCLTPIWWYCDGSLGDCDCVSRRAAALRDAFWSARPQHGTPHTYKHCKDDNGRPCKECRKANADRIRAYRHKKKEQANELERAA